MILPQLVLAFVISCIVCHVVKSESGEARVITKLLADRDVGKTLARPVKNASDPINLQFYMVLAQIVELDEEKQTLKIHLWESMVWNDAYIEWNPEEFDGVKFVGLPTSNLWIADFVPTKILNFEYPMPLEFMKAVVSYDGTVRISPQKIYDIGCQMDITLFPFDQHKCSIAYSSWLFDRTQFNVTLRDPWLSKETFTESQKWRLVNTSVEEIVFEYNCTPSCPSPEQSSIPIQMFEFTFTVKRQVGFFSFVLLLPAILLYLMTLITFCLPPDHSDKIQIGLSIFLSYFVLLLIVVDSSPPIGTSIPVIGNFFCLSLVLIALSVFLACLVFNIDHNSVTTRRFPTCLKGFIIKLSKILLISPRRTEPSIERRNSASCHGLEVASARNKVNDIEIPPPKSEISDQGLWFLLACVLDRVFLICYLTIKFMSLLLVRAWL